MEQVKREKEAAQPAASVARVHANIRRKTISVLKIIDHGVAVLYKYIHNCFLEEFYIFSIEKMQSLITKI